MTAHLFSPSTILSQAVNQTLLHHIQSFQHLSFVKQRRLPVRRSIQQERKLLAFPHLILIRQVLHDISLIQFRGIHHPAAACDEI